MTQLKRIRWGVRAALFLGVAASIAGNVLHAQDSFVSQVISAWSPIALLITIELISRIPVHRRSLAVARWGATALIAGIAAWVSYWHMAAVASRYGETGASPYLLPLSVDGLVVVASICLVELAGRIRAAEEGAGSEPLREGAEVGRADRAASGAGEERPGVDGERDQGNGEGEPQEEVGLKSSPSRKPHTANPQRVAQAHKRTPDATHEELAKRLNLSLATVKKYRPATSLPSPSVNGREPELVTVGTSEKED